MGCKFCFPVGVPAQAGRGTGTAAHADPGAADRGRGEWGYLGRSQSGCILPVLAHCCAQTNRLWILSKRQAEYLPHQQPVFPTGKWLVAKGRAFRETTKFCTHTIVWQITSGSLRNTEPLWLAGDGQVVVLPPPPRITYAARLPRSRDWWATFTSRAGPTKEQLSWREGAGCGEKLQCSEMTVPNGHGDVIELILLITCSNCSLQLTCPVTSKCTRCTQAGMQNPLFYWQLTSSCTSNEILSKLIMRIILSILVNMEMYLAEVSLWWGNRSHFK